MLIGFEEARNMKFKKIEEKMQRTQAQWNAKYVLRMYEGDELNFENALQRDLVWDDEKKSLMIHTIITNYPVYEIAAVKNGSKYDILDGKQRMLGTLIYFMKNEFELQGIPEIVLVTDEEEIFEVDCNGHKYEELPDIIREAIDAFTFNVIVLDENTPEEMVNEMFFRLNNYEPMSSIDMTRARAKSQKKIFEMAQHPIFTGYFTPSSLKKRKPEEVIAKMHTIMNYDNVDFDAKSIRKIVVDMEISDDDQNKIVKILDRMLKIYGYITNVSVDHIEEEKEKNKTKKFAAKVAKRIVTLTHMISCTPFIWKTIELGYSDKQAADWFYGFYCGTSKASVSALYNEACSAGSIKKENVNKRKIELTKNFNSWTKKNQPQANTETENMNEKSDAENVENTILESATIETSEEIQIVENTEKAIITNSTEEITEELSEEKEIA